MKITTQLSENDVIRFSFYAFYRKWIMRIVVAILAFNIMASILFPQILNSKLPDAIILTAAILVVLYVFVFFCCQETV